jgi:hypothetical protein
MQVHRERLATPLISRMFRSRAQIFTNEAAARAWIASRMGAGYAGPAASR